MREKIFNPYLEIVFAATIWGFAGLIVKEVNLAPTSLTFIRTLFPVLILTAYFLYKKQNIFHKNVHWMMIASVITAVKMLLFYIGYTYASIGNAVISLYTWPIFGTIFSVLFLKEKISKRNKILVFIAFVGMITIFSNREVSFTANDFMGMSAMILSGAMHALTVIIFKKEATHYSTIEILFYQNFFGVILFLPFALFLDPMPTISQFVFAGGYSILAGLVGFGLFFHALRRINASIASMLTYIEVVSAVAIGTIIYKEALSYNLIIGGVLIVFSTAMLIRKR